MSCVFILRPEALQHTMLDGGEARFQAEQDKQGGRGGGQKAKALSPAVARIPRPDGGGQRRVMPGLHSGSGSRGWRKGAAAVGLRRRRVRSGVLLSDGPSHEDAVRGGPRQECWGVNVAVRLAPAPARLLHGWVRAWVQDWPLRVALCRGARPAFLPCVTRHARPVTALHDGSRLDLRHCALAARRASVYCADIGGCALLMWGK